MFIRILFLVLAATIALNSQGKSEFSDLSGYLEKIVSTRVTASIDSKGNLWIVNQQNLNEPVLVSKFDDKEHFVFRDKIVGYPQKVAIPGGTGFVMGYKADLLGMVVSPTGEPCVYWRERAEEEAGNPSFDNEEYCQKNPQLRTVSLNTNGNVVSDLTIHDVPGLYYTLSSQTDSLGQIFFLSGDIQNLYSCIILTRKSGNKWKIRKLKSPMTVAYSQQYFTNGPEVGLELKSVFGFIGNKEAIVFCYPSGSSFGGTLKQSSDSRVLTFHCKLVVHPISVAQLNDINQHWENYRSGPQQNLIRNWIKSPTKDEGLGLFEFSDPNVYEASNVAFRKIRNYEGPVTDLMKIADGSFILTLGYKDNIGFQLKFDSKGKWIPFSNVEVRDAMEPPAGSIPIRKRVEVLQPDYLPKGRPSRLVIIGFDANGDICSHKTLNFKL